MVMRAPHWGIPQFLRTLRSLPQIPHSVGSPFLSVSRFGNSCACARALAEGFLFSPRTPSPLGIYRALYPARSLAPSTMSDQKGAQGPFAPVSAEPKVPRSAAQPSKEPNGGGGDMQRKKKRPLTDEERKEREVNRRAQHQLISHWRMERKSSREPGDDVNAGPKAPRLAQRPHQGVPPAPPAPPTGHSSLPPSHAHTLFPVPLAMDGLRGATILPPLGVPSIMEPKVAMAHSTPPVMPPPLMSPASLFAGSSTPPLPTSANPSEPLPSSSTQAVPGPSLVRDSAPPSEQGLTAASVSHKRLTSLESLANVASSTPQATRQSPSPEEDRKKPA